MNQYYIHLDTLKGFKPASSNLKLFELISRITLEVGEKEKPVNLMLTIRTKESNKVYVIDGDYLMYKSLTQIQGVKGFHSVIRNIQSLVLSNFYSEDSGMFECMSKSSLQYLGYVNDEDYVGLYLGIIINDDFAENDTFRLVDSYKSGNFYNISTLTTFTNLPYWSKILLPTLIEVKTK